MFVQWALMLDLCDNLEAAIEPVGSGPESLLLEVLHCLPTATLLVAKNGGIEFANRSALRLFKYERLQGSNIGLLIPDSLQAVHAHHVSMSPPHDTKSSRLMAERVVLAKKADGQELPVEVTLTPVTTRGAAYFLASVIDQTAKVEAERLAKYVTQQKRRSVTESVLSGVVHDLNNTLMVLYTSALTLSDSPSESERNECLGAIDAALEQGTNLVRNVLTPTSGEPAAEQVSLTELVRSHSRLVRHALGASVEQLWKLPSLALHAFVDPALLGRSLLNLMLNAKDAIKAQGLIEVELSRCILAVQRLGMPDNVPPGRYAVLSVRDDGAGIAPDVVSQIFEPYFSTKHHTQGSGMGLATVEHFVRTAQGYVTVQSRIGHGTHFKLWLPLVELQERPEGACFR